MRRLRNGTYAARRAAWQDSSMDASAALVRDLVELVIEFTWFLETYEGEHLDVHDVVKQLELIAYVLKSQSEADRQAVLGIIADMAEEASGAKLREHLENFPEAMGLIDS
ncbi:hypothetical protein ACIBF1_44295 [Spirillospora sp. NPDC050679]